MTDRSSHHYTESLTLISSDALTHCFEDGSVLLTANWGTSFYWMPSGEITQHIHATKEGIYQVTVSDAHQCFYTDEVLIKEHCTPRLFVTKAFSPNGDGQNNELEIFGAYFTNFKLMIFNRWGEVLFVSTDRNVRWDGMYRGEEMIIETYPWTISYESIYDPADKQKIKGSVTLVR